jgi:cation:H+ antiporter
MDVMTIVLFCLGLAVLVVGANWLVKGASRLAAAAGVSALVIGLTVVAFGTSAPELAVSVQSAWSGQSDMAVGNVVGSNIFNVLFILGASALITPLLVAQQLVRRDVPIMIVLSTGLWLIGRDGQLTLVDGLAMVAMLVVYTVWIIRVSRRETKAVEAEYEAEYGAAEATKTSVLANVGFVLAGLAMLVIGSNWLVDGAVAFARWAGVDEVTVSLTIVAAGTSLPEVATSITAAIRGERDIAVGNVVGSNIFNILSVLGLSAVVSPGGLAVSPAMEHFSIPVMIAVAVACLPVFARGWTIPRWQGALFLLYYAAYAAYLVLDAKQHAAKEEYARIMLWYVMPATAVPLLGSVVLVLRGARARSRE